MDDSSGHSSPTSSQRSGDIHELVVPASAGMESHRGLNIPIRRLGGTVGTSGTGGRASLGVSVNQFISQTPNASEAAMSQVRVHNFSLSLDGFGTGEGLPFDAPFGHAGHRLHEWVLPTRFGRSIIMGQSGGTTGVD